MNRKLQHSMTALSATAAVFGLLLLAGGPPQPMVSLAPSMTIADDGTDLPMEAAVDADRTTASSHRARAGLALPYFSFAQGLRRVTGS